MLVGAVDPPAVLYLHSEVPMPIRRRTALIVVRGAEQKLGRIKRRPQPRKSRPEKMSSRASAPVATEQRIRPCCGHGRNSRGAAPECSLWRKPWEQSRKSRSSGGAKDKLRSTPRRHHSTPDHSPVRTLGRNQKTGSLHRRRHARRLARPPYRLQRHRPNPT
jgi:hypothetical protein